MSKPVLLDAFSCAGLGADGYAAVGFEVVCLDNDPAALRHNPHATVCGDAMTLLRDQSFLSQFDAIHASPPCQLFSATRMLADAQGRGQGRAVDLLTPVLGMAKSWDMPWIIENVERSPLKGLPGVVRLCGSVWGLKVQRHRLFASNVDLGVAPACHHAGFEVDPQSGKPRPWGVYYAKGDNIPSGGRTCVSEEHARECMGVTREVPWRFLCEGLPPVYTRWLGRGILRQELRSGTADRDAGTTT